MPLNLIEAQHAKLSVRPRPASCQSCHLRSSCLAGGVRAEELQEVQSVVSGRRRLKPGETLFRSADEFTSVFAVRSGLLKASVLHCGGLEQVTGFVMDGDLLGIDGIGWGTYSVSVVALEESEVCVMPFSLIESMTRKYAALREHLNALLAREIRRHQDLMLLLGCMRGEERLATFLAQLSTRFVERGRSPSELHLRMTRRDIASYLGLKLETVSRLFSRLQMKGLICANGKHVRILDMARLANIVGSEKKLARGTIGREGRLQARGDFENAAFRAPQPPPG